MGLALLAGCGQGASPSGTTGAPSSGEAPTATVAATASAQATTAPTATATATAAPAPCETACLSIEKCEAGQCVPACPEGQVYVPKPPPEGFTMGRGEVPYGFGKLKDKNPGKGVADAPHKVILTRPFCMDATEVVVERMVKCVNEQGCQPPAITDRWSTYPKKLRHPVNMVNWDKARYFCEQQGQSLPTEAQWEWAATGGDGRKWPWGNESPTCEHADFTEGTLPSPGGDAGCHGGGPSEVATHPKGDRVFPTGHIHDLAGNVWEWQLDAYRPFTTEDATDPLPMTPGELAHVVRGGGWNRSHRGIMASFRGGAIHTYQVPGLGFRCVTNPK